MSERVPDQILESVAQKFRTVGEPTRLAILHALIGGGEKSVGQVVLETGRIEVNVSRHLKRLAQAGMVGRRKEGLQVFYRLTDPVMEKVCRLVCDSLLGESARPRRGDGAKSSPPSKT